MKREAKKVNILRLCLPQENGLKKAICETSDTKDNNEQHDVKCRIGRSDGHVLPKGIRPLRVRTYSAKVAMGKRTLLTYLNRNVFVQCHLNLQNSNFKIVFVQYHLNLQNSISKIQKKYIFILISVFIL